MLEQEVVEDCLVFAARHGWIGERFEKTRRGNSDWIFLGPRNGHFFVEFKRPKEVANSQQNYRIEKLRRMGHDAFVCDSPELFRQHFGRYANVRTT